MRESILTNTNQSQKYMQKKKTNKFLLICFMIWKKEQYSDY